MHHAQEGIVASALYARLQSLCPTHLEVIDDTHHHAGHAPVLGMQAKGISGETHFTINIASPLLLGKSRVECHRLIYHAVGDLMDKPIHALKLNITKSL